MSGSWMRKVWIRIMLVLGLFSCCAGLSPLTVQAANLPKTVRVGWYEVPGLQEGQNTGALGGYNYEYLAKIAQYANWNYEFVFCTWPEAEEKLKKGEIDIVGDVAKTAPRMAEYNYCDYPNGYSRMIMACRQNDNRFGYNEYAAFDNLTVATVPSSFRRYLLNREAAKHHFKVSYKEYQTEQDMFTALDRGEADVAIFSNVTEYSRYKVVSEWEANPYYFVVTKERPDILDDLNDAMLKIQSTDMFMPERLFKKYFEKNDTGTTVAFTRREMVYLAGRPQIKVLLPEGDFPIAYWEEGKARGIGPAYLEALAVKSGLQLEFIPCANGREMNDRFQKGEGDVCIQMPDDFFSSQQKNANLTQPYLNLTYGLVNRQNDVTGVKTVAIGQRRSILQPKLQKLGYRIKEYNSITECLDAVLDHEVDAAAVSSLTFDQFSYHAKYQDLSFHAVPSLDVALCYGVSKRSDHNLFTVLEKAASAVNNSTLEAIITQYSSLPHKYTLRDYLQYGAPFLLAILLLLLTVAGLSFFFRRQRQFNRQLAAAKLKADQASEAKSQFLSSVSHDLRTPLNGIIGFTEIALDEPDAVKKQGYLEKIRASGRLLLGLVNDTLDLSRIESGKVVMQPEAVRSADISRAVVTALQPEADLKGIHLMADYANFPNEILYVDKLKIQKIVLNLLSNAIKYTPQNGTVIISVQALEPPVKGCNRRIIVEDNGIGMSRAFLKRLYDPFAQEHRPEAANVTGTGLGLAFVKRAVDMMGGFIQVQSQLNRGTRFTVDLPMPKATEAQIKKEAPPEPVQNLTGKRVLLCEDNHINTEIATILLKNKGLQVETAVNGAEGVKKFTEAENGYYDLVLMDIHMPLMDGYEATRRIRALNRRDGKTVPIIAMTADAFEEKSQAGLKAGLNAYLSKPVDPKKLFRVLGEQLRS
jgi:signal transduction histidine kinase/ActR/RegA family two-component response regulator